MEWQERRKATVAAQACFMEQTQVGRAKKVGRFDEP